MNTLGILGGIGWESTLAYYQRLNRGIEARLGLPHSARLLINSLDYAAIEHAPDSAALTRLLGDAALTLQQAGADALLIASNSLHKVADAVAGQLDIPLLHIGDAIGAALAAQGIRRLALLGTRSTMEGEFIVGRLAERWGITCLTPADASVRAEINRLIYDELALAQVTPAARALLLEQAALLQADGAEALLLGCSELPHAIRPADVSLPLFESTDLHVAAALDFLLEKHP